ncbi:DUF3560 domain-containing protein, partial [Flexithrix dorotheae]|uniref:DUF3560 domain-containing protein n=1 Tax=Flexithrix dorotheae TaxID=70993 RepID=UPI0004766930
MTQSRSIALHGTDQNYYVTNLETGKIELHFDYQTYKDLEQDLKKEIKRYFLWSRGKQAWISKAKEMTYGIQQIIAKTDLTDNGTIGEKISFEEQISRKVSRAENKISRLQDRKEKSKKRQEQFQSEANRFSGDISFWTQPNINSGKGRSFTNYRNRVIARYEKGLKEHAYREYLDNKIGAAISTANQRQLKDVGFLNRRIAENEKRYRKLKKSLDDTEKLLQQGNLSEEKKEQIQKNVNWWSGNLQEVIDKLNFYKLKIEEAGGVLYSKESVKDWAAYVNYRGAWYPIKSFNTKTITFLNWHRIAKFEWKTPYAEIKPGALKKIGEITVLDRDGNEVLPKVNLKPKVEKSQSEKTKPEEEKETEETNPQQKTDTSLEIIDYSEKSIALKGTDLEMGINKDFLWEKFNLWGTFNVRLKDQNGKKFSGWIFKKTDQEKVKELVKFLEAGNKGDGKKRERSHSKKGREKHVKSLVSIDQHVVFLAWKKADDYDNQRKSYIHNPSFKTYLDDKHNLYIVSKYTQIDPWTGS